MVQKILQSASLLIPLNVKFSRAHRIWEISDMTWWHEAEARIRQELEQLLQNHSIAWVGRTFWIIQFQTPCHGQGCLPVDQVALSSIQLGLKHFQVQGIHNFSGQRVPVPHYPHSKNFFPTSNLNLPSFSYLNICRGQYYCILLTLKTHLIEFCFPLTIFSIVCCTYKPEINTPKLSWPRKQVPTAKLQVRPGTGCYQFSAEPPHCRRKTRTTFRRWGMMQ